MFCSLADLLTESDVEQKLLWHVLCAANPRGLGYVPSEVFTKTSLRRLPIGKGTSQKLYFPDYVVLMAGAPLVVVEAKSPSEDVDSGLDEARMYAARVNEAFPSEVNPCQWVVASNGRELIASKWDTLEVQHRLDLSEINVMSLTYARLIEDLSRERLSERVNEFRYKSVVRPLYRAVSNMGGASVRNEEIGHNTFGSALALDFRRIFDPASPMDRAYLVRNAYVPSKRRERFVEPIDKLIRQIAHPAIDHITAIENTGEPREISRTLQKRSLGSSLERQVMLLVGSVGSGKSTFVDYLVNVALPQDLLKKTVWLRINLNLAPQEGMQSWLVAQLIRELRASAPTTDFDELESLRAVYSVELERLKRGALKILSPKSPAYQERLADELLAMQKNDLLTVNALSRYLCSQRGKLMVVVLDNCDKRTREEQLTVFQLAQWVQSELHCLTILPLRDVTYDTCRNDPPLDTAQKDLVFRIEPPQFTAVLQARVALALKELQKQPGKHLEYTLNGMRVQYPASDQGMYLACILRSLYEHDAFLRKLLVGLAGRDIRKALEIFLQFCQSGYISESEIFKVKQSRGNYALPLRIIASVLLRLDRRFYDGDESHIKNVFQADPRHPLPDHFVRVAILRALSVLRREKGPSGIVGYHAVANVTSLLTSLAHSDARIREELLYLLRGGCIIAEHQRTDVLRDGDLITLSPSGSVHLDMLNNVHYLAACAEDTWMSNQETVVRIGGRIGQSRLAHMAETTIAENARDFVDYIAWESARWPGEANDILQPPAIERLHDWSDALVAVEADEHERRRAARSGRLYVGNLPYDVSKEQIAALFAEASLPAQEVFIPRDDAGNGRGFAFVALGDAHLVLKAIDKLSHRLIGGRPIKVRLADDRKP